MKMNEDYPNLATDARQGGARTAGSRVRVTKDGRVLYASRGFALCTALSQGWTEDPQPPGLESWGGGSEPESFNPGDTGRRGQVVAAESGAKR